MEFSSSSTPTHSNTCGSDYIQTKPKVCCIQTLHVTPKPKYFTKPFLNSKKYSAFNQDLSKIIWPCVEVIEKQMDSILERMQQISTNGIKHTMADLQN
jgi:hypothetical protein